MDIEGGFLVVAIASFLVTVALTADAAVAYRVVPPLGLGRISRLRVAHLSNRGRRVSLVGGAFIAAVAQFLMLRSVSEAYATEDLQRMAAATLELVGAVAWFILLWQGYRSRPQS